MPMSNELLHQASLVPGVAAVSQFSLRVLTLHVQYSVGHLDRVKIVANGRECSVETGTAVVFEALGYEAIPGADIHEASYAICNKWLTKSDLHLNNTDYGASQAALVRATGSNTRLLKSFFDGTPSSLVPLLENFLVRWCTFYRQDSFTHKQNHARAFVDFLTQHEEIAQSLLSWYKGLPYDPRGAPDLFLWNRHTGDWFWAEVKSASDKIRHEQWAWIEGFQLHVNKNVFLIRLLPAPYVEPSPAIAEYIAVNTTFHNGEPVFKRRTYRVGAVVRDLLKNKGRQEIAKQYGLLDEEIDAALAYVAQIKYREEGTTKL